MTLFRKIYNKINRKITHDYRLIPLSLIHSKHYVNPSLKKIFILTYCKTEKQLYGTTLIFKSLRKGFPNSYITVIDNNSITDARQQIKKLAKETGCHYFQLENNIAHSAYIENIIMDQPLEGTVIILDPDVVFWKNCENWNFNKLLAGSLMPSYIGELSQCVTEPRIHTSFYWIQDINRLRKKIRSLKKQYFEFNPFMPIMFKWQGAWRRFDTGGTLCAAIKEECHYFSNREHDAFDHIFGGTHLNLYIQGVQNKQVRQQLITSHTNAQNDYTKLRGIWRTQLKYLRKPPQNLI